MQESLCPKEVTINGVVYKNDFWNEVEIDDTDINTECLNQARFFSYYGFLAKRAEGQCSRLKYKLECLYASIDKEKREEAQGLMNAGSKFKFTETMYENMVKTDARYQKLMTEYLDSRELSAILDVQMSAFYHKQSSIKEYAANNRASSGELRLNR